MLLVGFMGSGKSTVGRELSTRLGWTFIDFDAEIARRAGASVAEIFEGRGERFFRTLEADVAVWALSSQDAVLAAGGGWAAAPGRITTVPADTATVWLRIDADTALGRLGRDATRRPLLEVPDPHERARRLLSKRDPHYSLAGLHVDAANSSPEDLAHVIASRLGLAGGSATSRERGEGEGSEARRSTPGRGRGGKVLGAL